MSPKNNIFTNLNDEKPKRKRSIFRDRLSYMDYTQIMLLFLALTYSLYFIRPVLLPLILALLLSLIFKPIHRSLCILKIPSALSSIMIILSLIGILLAGIFKLSVPAIEYSDKLANNVVKERLQSVFKPITEIQDEITVVAKQVETITNEKPKEENIEPEIKDTKQLDAERIAEVTGEALAKELDESEPISVSLKSDPVEKSFNILKSVGYYIVITFSLLYFFLAYGESMLVRITEVEDTATLLGEVAGEISNYMFTITAINVALGIIVGLIMYFLGMPNPILWGVLAAVLNFIPYIGAIIGTVIVFLVAATHFDSQLSIIIVPAAYYLASIIEGNFITPAIVGRNFTINPIVIFVWVLSWGALWGIAGMLIGLPLLMTCRIILRRWGKLKRLERIISAS